MADVMKQDYKKKPKGKAVDAALAVLNLQNYT